MKTMGEHHRGGGWQRPQGAPPEGGRRRERGNSRVRARLHALAGRALLLLLPAFLGLALSSSLHSEEIPPRELENLGLPNWAGHDYAPAISPDGEFLVFQSDRPGSLEGNNLWFTVNRNKANKLGEASWTVPLPLRLPFLAEPSRTMEVLHPPGTFSVNTDGFDGMAYLLYRKGLPVEIYFTSLRDSSTGRDGYDGTNIYFSRYRDGRWSKPVHLNLINSDFNDRMPVLSRDGRRMYFASDRPGGFGGFDLWYSERDLSTGLWARPVNLGENFNTLHNEISPKLSPGGKMLFFSSDRPGGFGHYDLYVSRFDGYSWDLPKNLGVPFNSERDDESLSLTEDGLWAYFTSDRQIPGARGGFDLYRVTLPPWLRESESVLFTGLVLDGVTRQPSGVEATIHVRFEKETLVTTSQIFRKDPGDRITNNFAITLGSGRVYRVEFTAPGYYPHEVILDYTGNLPAGKIDRREIVLQPIRPGGEKPEEFRMIQGVVKDADTGLVLPGSTVQYAIAGGLYVPAEVDRNGLFSLKVKKGASFTVAASAPGYRPAKITRMERSDLTRVEIRLKPVPGSVHCPGDRPECIDNLRVYFALDRAEISQKEAEKVATIARIMKLHPELKIEIQGHTDRTYRGPRDQAFQYNKRLSEMRARAVKKKLQEEGIKEERLKIRGFSYTMPRVKADTPKERALNRRVEFRRIRKEPVNR